MIGIVIDIDGDGYYSAAMLYKYLKIINPTLNIQPIFHNTREHGLSLDIMKQLATTRPNIVFCPDSASGDFKQHKILKDSGITCICIDHHPVSKLSKNAIVINNHLSPNIRNKSASGGLVTWKYLKMIDSINGTNYTAKMVDMAYFSLISDIMNMTSLENRLFACYGKNIQHKLLKALCSEFIKDGIINNEALSWNVQPKISAIIRCQDKELKEALFYALATEENKYIDHVMTECKKVHSEQKRIVESTFKEMVGTVDEGNNIIFEPSDNIYPYYTGLIGSKINNKYNKPCILYRKGKNKYIGSVRSPYPIKQQLIDSGVFTSIGGHDSACGLEFSLDKLDNVIKFVKEIKLDDSCPVTQSLHIDKIPQDIFTATKGYEDIFGNGIPEPTFHIHGIKINSSSIREMGKGSTIKFSCQGIDFIKFYVSKQEREEQWYVGQNKDLYVEIVGKFQINSWKGTNTPQAIIERFEVCERVNKFIDWKDLF